MSCPPSANAPFRCPSLDESTDATLSLLPRGRAWPANDGGGLVRRFRTWLAALTGVPQPADWPLGYVQAGYVSAVAAVRHFVEARLCELRREFWCATHVETQAEWLAEYGLPDDCDPFPDLCLKVRAIGGQRCDYFNAIIARLGWTTECFETTASCGSRAGKARAGCAQAGFKKRNALKILVKVGNQGDPTITPPKYWPPRAGCMRAGQRPSCTKAARIAPVRCLLDRIAPAHVQIEYV